MGQLKTDGTEQLPTFRVVRTIKRKTVKKLGDHEKETNSRSREAAWKGEAAEWHDAIAKAGDAFGEIPEDADEVTFKVKRVGA